MIKTNGYYVSILLILIITNACFGQNGTTQHLNVVKYSTSYLRENNTRIEKTIYNGDSTYKVLVLPGDFISNGNRSEIHLGFDCKYKHTYNYSWDFMLSSEFLQSDLPKYHIIIAQWLDRPPKGKTWSDVKGKAGPPFYFSIIKENGKLFLQIYYGLHGLNRKKRAQFEIYTDKWYNFDVTAFWSNDYTGYALVKINDKNFTFRGPNKYSNSNNLFKLGLYRNKNNKDTTEAFIKNIHIIEKQ